MGTAGHFQNLHKFNQSLFKAFSSFYASRSKAKIWKQTFISCIARSDDRTSSSSKHETSRQIMCCVLIRFKTGFSLSMVKHARSEISDILASHVLLALRHVMSCAASQIGLVITSLGTTIIDFGQIPDTSRR